ncbi:MAG TPA: IS1 family transposase [Candidatus Megaira endosymbiont of Nemacystus decipiens]|nr:IS1 family transposase [Candidatus Megaera endosymbiont of Nemacystus decipiens]
MYLYKKRPKNGGGFTFVWIAVNRNKSEVIDFEVGDRSKSTYLNLARRIEEKYKIHHLCTDDYKAYKYYKISEHHHTTKSETSLVESVNSLVRHYLARFNRKTKRYSKSIDMINASLTLLFNKKLLNLNFYL